MDILKYCSELDSIMSESPKKKRLLKESSVKKPVKNSQKNRRINENYGNDGYMYLTKHGLGPGTLPKDVHLLKSKDLPHYMTAIWLDRFLTTDELKKFDIYPETEIRRVMDFYDISEKDLLDEAYVNPETGEEITNIYGMTNITIEVEKENRIVVYADTKRFGKHEIMAECTSFKDAFDYVKRELGCNKLDFTTRFIYGGYTDINGETFPTYMWDVRPSKDSMNESCKTKKNRKKSLKEKLVEAPKEVVDELLQILEKHGFILDDSIKHENPIRTWMGAIHIQVINPDSIIDEDGDIGNQLKKYVTRELIDEIQALEDRSGCPITWNFGPNVNDQVTGGLDVDKQWIEDGVNESVGIRRKRPLKEESNKYLDKVIVELDDEDGDYAYEVRGNKLHNKYGFYQGVIILEDDESQERLKKLGIKPGDEFVVGIRKPTSEEQEMYDDAMDDTFYMADILYRYNESLKRNRKSSIII